MKKILLTSTGLENKVIKKKFLELVNKNPDDIHALFITTAAIEPDAIMVLPKCLEDLTDCGIPMNNITVYDMHKLISYDNIRKYDVVYVCGGETSYLVDRINEIGFKDLIDQYIANDGIYIGVSAGSVAASGKYSNGLDFLKNKVNVHCDKGSSNGNVMDNSDIYLTDNQAILITDNQTIIFE